jgi:ABC-type branched-subunit amino acid transport system substrate-binding protein
MWFVHCPATQSVSLVDPVVVSVVEERASDPAAAQRLDEVRALLDAQAWMDAQMELELWLAEFPEDPGVSRAEVWLNRARMGLGEFDAALPALRQVLADSRVPSLVAATARVYLAWGLAQTADVDGAMDAMQALDATDVASLPWALILDVDHAQVASLWAERQLGTASAASELDALAALERVALSAGGDEGLLLYAYDRALEVAESLLALEDLQQAWTTGSPFVRGTVAGALVDELVAAQDVAAAAQVVSESRDVMMELGLAHRARAAQARLSMSSQRPLMMGAVVSLTGGERRVGRSVLASLLLAQRSFEPEPATTTMVFGDSAGSPEAVEQEVARMAAAGATIIIGPPEPALAAAAARAAQTAGVPFIDTTSVPRSTATPSHVRIQADPRTEVAAGLGHAMGSAVGDIVILAESGASSDSYQYELVRAAEAFAARQGALATVVFVDPEPATLTDSAGQAARELVATPADTIYFATSAPTTAAVAAWLASLGHWPGGSGGQRAWVGNSFAVDASLLRDSARYVEGMVFPFWFERSLAAGPALTFAVRFETTYGRPATSLEAFTMVAAVWARDLLQAAGGEAAAVAERLQSDTVFDSMLGPAARDQFGNVLIEPGLATVDGGRFVLMPHP